MSDEEIYAARLELVDFLIEALWDTPSEEFVGTLLSGEIRVPESVGEDLDAGFERLRTFIEENEGRDAEVVHRELNREYTRVFVGPRPPVMAHESYYREEMDFLGKGKAEVEASYAAAGWNPPEDYPEEADFLAVELAFLRHLIERQRRGAAEAFGYERVFLEEHMAHWIDDCAGDIVEYADGAFYEAVGRLLSGVVAFEYELAGQMA
ncbi:molecular chaperone [Halalkalicoccus sp. NIPERK01]|uniref:TorD/DmsD family molecular chaperone n=1 Tax=Halalkalicoccus sp. NIPERK01 TaxID=3053469 RepID=UPI00256EEEB7|nr:molecular chaperone TorD family protein [Halalkalicoccus sp. NIPERK01]MDL5362124.1 molecular chaperone TorD family protein [Halalkalicoccus sp. NIPERK01]